MLYPWQKWSRQCIVSAPSLGYSVTQRARLHAYFFGPLRNAFCLFVIGHKYVSRRIPALLFRCGPSAVLGSVIPVAVDSVNAVFRGGRFSHVFQEIFKLVPAFADLYPSAPINFPLSRLGVETSSFHPGPRPVNPCSKHSMLWSADMMRASTGICVARQQRIGSNYLCGATVTEAFPDRHDVALLNAACVPRDKKPSKLLPRQIFDSLGQYNIFSHSLFTLGNWLDAWLCLQHGHALSFNYTSEAAW